MGWRDDRPPNNAREQRAVIVGMILRRIPSDGITVAELVRFVEADSQPIKNKVGPFWFDPVTWLRQKTLVHGIRTLEKRRLLRIEGAVHDLINRRLDRVRIYPLEDTQRALDGLPKPSRQMLDAFPLNLLDRIAFS